MSNANIYHRHQEAISYWIKQDNLIEEEINECREEFEISLRASKYNENWDSETLVLTIDELMESLLKELECLRQLKCAIVDK